MAIDGGGSWGTSTGTDTTWKIDSGTFGGPAPDSYFTTTTDYNSLINTLGTTHTDPCQLLGHNVEKWAEYIDGECVGTCTNCMTRVQSKRMPGGVPFMRLKALIELLLGAPKDAALFLELNEVTDLLEAEQRALDEAKALLATARKMARCDESS